jgi:hypothetical protein
MGRIALVVVSVTVTAVAGVAAYMESASGQSNGDASPIYGVKLPEGYRDWRLISVKRAYRQATHRYWKSAHTVAR